MAGLKLCRRMVLREVASYRVPIRHGSASSDSPVAGRLRRVIAHNVRLLGPA
jgi:hypothetical protein